MASNKKIEPFVGHVYCIQIFRNATSVQVKNEAENVKSFKLSKLTPDELFKLCFEGPYKFTPESGKMLPIEIIKPRSM